MTPLLVIKHLFVFKNTLSRLITRPVAIVMRVFGLQGMEEALHRRVVQTIAFAAHARRHTVIVQEPVVLGRAVFHALIGMEQRAGQVPASADGHRDCIEHQLAVGFVGHRPTHDEA